MYYDLSCGIAFKISEDFTLLLVLVSRSCVSVSKGSDSILDSLDALVSDLVESASFGSAAVVGATDDVGAAANDAHPALEASAAPLHAALASAIPELALAQTALNQLAVAVAAGATLDAQRQALTRRAAAVVQAARGWHRRRLALAGNVTALREAHETSLAALQAYTTITATLESYRAERAQFEAADAAATRDVRNLEGAVAQLSARATTTAGAVATAQSAHARALDDVIAVRRWMAASEEHRAAAQTAHAAAVAAVETATAAIATAAVRVNHTEAALTTCQEAVTQATVKAEAASRQYKTFHRLSGPDAAAVAAADVTEARDKVTRATEAAQNAVQAAASAEQNLADLQAWN